MKISVLMDNNAAEGLRCEWGFAALIEYEDVHVLLDAGASGAFAENAQAMGIDLGTVDCAVLSHAHYDHSDGMPAFFEANDHAKFYLRAGAAENCYDLKEGEHHYIGIAQGTLARFADRIEYVEGAFELAPGAWLIPHSTPGLAQEGERQNMLVAVPDEAGSGAAAAAAPAGTAPAGTAPEADEAPAAFVPDDFSHEQSLVFDAPDGLVVFSSCSHGGADAIIREVCDAFPGKRVRTLVGGLHLFLDSEERVRALAARLRELGLEQLVTGHCTGDAAFAILREELGDVVSPLRAGLVVEC